MLNIEESKIAPADLARSERSERSAKSAGAISPEQVKVVFKKRYDNKYKLKVLNELDLMPSNERGLYLRKNGLYSSLISNWRAELQKGIKRTGNQKSRDNKSELDILKQENIALKKRNETLEGLIELQKKMAELLGAIKTKEV